MILNVCPNPSIDCYAWLEDFHPGQVNRIGKLEEYPGGKGVHVALAISELGGTSRLLGNWGGAIGNWIKAKCIEKNVEIAGIELEGNNRKCYTFRSANPTFSNTEVLEPGPTMNEKNWQDLKNSFKKELNDADLVCLSGSWPINAPTDAYSQLINLAKTKNRKVVLDCSGEPLKKALNSPFYGLHLNEYEAYELCGSKDFNDLLEKLGGTVELIALTRGKEGLWLAYKGKIYHAKVKVENVISTVGSGDCLTAGIAWALEKNMDPKEIASYAVACGAANCLNEELGMIDKKDVERLLPKVECNIVGNER